MLNPTACLSRNTVSKGEIFEPTNEGEKINENDL